MESLLTDGKPVCIIDPKGDWWGLKSSASGKQAGFPVIIFGGEHADISLIVDAGAYVAELVATGNRPRILDLGGWTVGEVAGVEDENGAPIRRDVADAARGSRESVGGTRMTTPLTSRHRR